MKKTRLILLLTMLFISALSFGQTQKKPASTKVVALKKCHVLGDTANTGKLKVAEILAWFDKQPLEVADAAGKVYIIQQYNFTMITMNPLQTRDFGVASDVVPLLAKKGLAALKPADTIFLKEITAKDSDGKVEKIANIIFTAIE